MNIESTEKHWQGILKTLFKSTDDWAVIYDEGCKLHITVRNSSTRPTDAIVDEMLNRLNTYEETKQQLEEAQNQLSQIYRWIERHNQDGFIDSLTYTQNLDRCVDALYDKLEIAEHQNKKSLR